MAAMRRSANARNAGTYTASDIQCTLSAAMSLRLPLPLVRTNTHNAECPGAVVYQCGRCRGVAIRAAAATCKCKGGGCSSLRPRLARVSFVHNLGRH